MLNNMNINASLMTKFQHISISHLIWLRELTAAQSQSEVDTNVYKQCDNFSGKGTLWTLKLSNGWQGGNVVHGIGHDIGLKEKVGMWHIFTFHFCNTCGKGFGWEHQSIIGIELLVAGENLCHVLVIKFAYKPLVAIITRFTLHLSRNVTSNVCCDVFILMNLQGRIRMHIFCSS